tara:strand:- start:602 stop:1246 length:645 start_codon:yes stop_codon:yes gene_type:complete
MDNDEPKEEIDNEVEEDENDSDIGNDDIDDNNSIIEEEDQEQNEEDIDEEDIENEEEDEEKLKDIGNTLQTFDKKLLENDYDLENNDSAEFLQKFNEESKDDYIVNNHFELLNKNLDEIKKLSVVTRDNNNNIIDEFHKTLPILTKYEKTKILGIRLKQLNNGSQPVINISENIIDNNIIALQELENKKLPFIIVRPIPNKTFEYWKLKDLEVN